MELSKLVRKRERQLLEFCVLAGLFLLPFALANIQPLSGFNQSHFTLTLVAGEPSLKLSSVNAPDVIPPPDAPHFPLNATIGGTGGDLLTTSQPVSTGGYIATGWTDSWGAGGHDIWLVRTDDAGTVLWNTTWGGTGLDEGLYVIECRDGGFAVSGLTVTFGTGGSWSDVCLVKFDENGNQLWNHTYTGSTNPEWGETLIENCEGGFTICGTHGFWSGGPEGQFQLIRTNSTGHELWRQNYGDSQLQRCIGFTRCADGGYAIAGYTETGGGGNLDAWIVRTDAMGALVWDNWYGGSGEDVGRDIVELDNGNLVFGGHSASYGPSFDAWLVGLDPVGNVLWSNTYGTSDYEECWRLLQCEDNGFAITGTHGTGAGREAYLMRADAAGNELWNLTEGGSDYEVCRGLSRTDTGEFILTSITASYGTAGDGWLLGVRPIDWVADPSTQIVELGGSLSYDLDVTSYLSVSQWSLNDTTHFSVDSNGLITSTGSLVVGSYGVQVMVKDTANDWLVGEFTVMVVDTTAPSWTVAPTNQILGYTAPLDYDLDATDLSGIALWTVNDTTNFNIGETGRITSVGILSPGDYGVRVQVRDPYDNVLTGEFTVTVQGAGTILNIYIAEIFADETNILVTIMVKDELGSPITGATVTGQIGVTPYVASDEGGGEYEFTLPYTDTSFDLNIAASRIGYTADSETVTIYIDPMTVDETPPGISSISSIPTSPLSTETVAVSATITDALTGVKNATVYYQVNSGAWTTVLMSHTDSTYSANIPAQIGGAQVRYYIEAFDFAGHRETSSEYTYTVQATPPPIPGFPAAAILLGILAVISIGVLVRRQRRKA